MQDLKRIRLIDAGIEASLNKLGVTRYEHIAGWMRDDVKKVSQALGIKGRINQENWIEQALILAKGGETHYSARRARGEAATAAPTSDEGERGIECRATAAAHVARRRGRRGRCPAPGRCKASAGSRALPLPSPPMVSERAAFASGTVRSPAASRPRMPSTQYRPCLCARRRLRTTICSASAASRPRSKRT